MPVIFYHTRVYDKLGFFLIYVKKERKKERERWKAENEKHSYLRGHVERMLAVGW